ncbi:MAG: thiolase family protein [Pseudomonadota bacterium]
MAPTGDAYISDWEDAWLLDGVRTPFTDLNGALALISPIDLGIKVARSILMRSGTSPSDIGAVIAGCMAQASYDAYMTPRHIGLYSGVPRVVPAYLLQRVCGTGVEVLSQAADAVSLGRADVVLCVGTESMSRNPIAAYTHRGGFRMGQVEFKDFLWEALIDPAADVTMGGTAENLAKRYEISREDVDRFASQSFDRALAARDNGFLAGEIEPVISESFDIEGLRPRGIRLSRKINAVTEDSHIRSSPPEVLAKIRPAFGGVQTGGNSSAVVDGAAAALVASGRYIARHDKRPLAKIHASVAIGVDPDIMGIGPVPAIQRLLRHAGLSLDMIDRIEINEAFGAQVMACARELGLDERRLNVNGGAIAIGHPLAATGIRLATTVSRELMHQNMRYGIASACIGGGQGIAMLLENPDHGA